MAAGQEVAMTTPQMASTDEIRGAWNGIARGFDEFVTPENLLLGKEIVRRLGLRPGTRLLDVVRRALDAGAAGVAHGRNVWGRPDPGAAVAELRAVVHPEPAALGRG